MFILRTAVRPNPGFAVVAIVLTTLEMTLAISRGVSVPALTLMLSPLLSKGGVLPVQHRTVAEIARVDPSSLLRDLQNVNDPTKATRTSVVIAVTLQGVFLNMIQLRFPSNLRLFVQIPFPR